MHYTVMTKGKKNTINVSFAFNRTLLENFKSAVDGRKWNAKDKIWTIPNKQILVAVKVFGGIKCISADDYVKNVYTEEKNRRIELDVLRTRLDADIEVPTKIQLRPYQLSAIQFMDRAGGRAMLADSMGLGKTLTSIGFSVYKQAKTLIICPKSVIVHWKREILVATGKHACIWDTAGKSGRIDSTYHIANYDIIGKILPNLIKCECDLLIIDEATNIKNPRTKRTKSIIGSYRERKKYPGIKTKWALLLTGTPILNAPGEIFSLLSYLDKGRFNNFFHFCQLYGGWRGETPKNLLDLHERTKDLILRRTVEDVKLELPEKQRIDITVEMTKTERTRYNEYMTELFNDWRVAGRPSVKELPKIQNYLFGIKKSRVQEIIDQLLAEDKSVLIFSVYKDPLFELAKLYPADSVVLTGEITNVNKRQDIIDSLASGKKKIGLVSLGVGSMGIDSLQKSISTVIFLNLWFVPAMHAQAESRIHRSGQKEITQAYYMLCEDTIDQTMRDILSEKQKIIDAVVEGRQLTLDPEKSFFKQFIKELKFYE